MTTLDDLRDCRIAGCTRRHQRRYFCCGAHWHMLPKRMKNAIWRAYRHNGVFSDEYLQAAENAEAWLEDREPRTIPEVFS